MKHFILTLSVSVILSFGHSVISFASPFAPDPATEVVVYSSERSASALHVSTISTNPTDTVTAKSFPSSYAGHRSVCTIPGTTTNDVFCAWVGGDNYTPGDPFGVSYGRDYPVLELTGTSPIVDRLNPWTGIGDRTIHPVPTKKYWIDTLATDPEVRVRLVRYSIDGIPCSHIGIANRVVADFRLSKNVRPFVCECDVIGTNGVFDIDSDFLTIDISNLDLQNYEITNATYMVVLGEGNTDIPFTDVGDPSVTNVCAMPVLVERVFSSEIKPYLIPVSSSTRQGSTIFRFKIDSENPSSWYGTSFTSVFIRVMRANQIVYDSGNKRLPPRGPDGIYTLEIPETFNPEGLTWKGILHNAKFQRLTNTFFSDPKPLNE